ncbi:hypothetical protein EVAR_31200_1 [Eumeta japonica]|uniref:Uncharacterized protein n=1 Tax=Eumeta variegata TaxID=151549 RepID=A0A4C1VVQ4_EUMVA|nr:hypothetical protein EVAR_31200_1 [Eumeta japonica]
MRRYINRQRARGGFMINLRRDPTRPGPPAPPAPPGIKVMVFERGESTTECDINIEGERVEHVKEFVYFSNLFTNDGNHDRYIERRVNVGNKANGNLLAVMYSKSVSRQAHLAIHNGVLILTFMYDSKSWVWQKKNESRINAVEVRSLCGVCGVSRKDRCRNSDVRERCGLKKDVVTWVERAMLR